MYKFIHRSISIVIIFTMFFLTVYLTNQLSLPLFVAFLLGIPIICIPLAMFLKVPFICDQKGCHGSAHLVIKDHLQGKWYRHFLLSGHQCDECNHFIKLPKTRGSSDHNFY